MRRVLSAVLAASQHGAQSIGSRIRRLGNADTALFTGWAMVTVGCGLVSLAGGLIVGGLFLMGGALFTARGDQ
jgi:hypothetical protein